MTLAVDYLAVCEEVLALIRTDLAGYIDAWRESHDGVAVTPVACYGINDAAAGGKSYPAILVYPDSSQDESEEQGVSDTVVSVAVGVFVSSANASQNITDIMAYASAVDTLFRDKHDTDYICDIRHEDQGDAGFRGTTNIKQYVTWISCHVRTEVNNG